MKELATLVSLGATRAKALRIFFIQLVLLGLLAALPASLASSLFLPVLSHLLSGLGVMQVEVSVSWRSVLFTLGVAVASGWLLALPSLSKIRRLKPSELFLEAARPGSQPSKTSLLHASRSRRFLGLNCGAGTLRQAYPSLFRMLSGLTPPALPSRPVRFCPL